MANVTHHIADIDEVKFSNLDAEGSFAFSIGCLVLLVYVECLIVAYIFIRKHPVVYPLTKPPRGQHFCEYFILLKTSIKPSSSFDYLGRGRISMQILGNFGDSPLLELKKGRATEDFLSRGGANIFVYHSPYDLGAIQSVKFELINDAPYEIEYLQWRPCFVSVMRPSTREHWGSRTKQKIRAREFVETEFECTAGLRDRNGILKSILHNHVWFSILNRPVRFGMYTNIVNTIMNYFALFSIGGLAILHEYLITASDRTKYSLLSDTNSVVYNRQAAALLIALVVGFFSIVCEVMFRNTGPKFCCQSLKSYTGLSEAISSPYILRDFFINYNWDEVKPLLGKSSIIIIRGTQHGYAHSVFPITTPHSVHNLWGFFSDAEQKQWSIFMRSINRTALPLPLSMRWLSKEAWSNIEQCLMTAHQSDYKAISCFFHVWLQDWPLNYALEPNQAGLIVSNIICRNITSLTNRAPDETRSRLARLCLFQWYGLIIFIFMRIIMQEADRRNESTLNIKSFIYRVIDQHSYRSPAEIQSNWQKKKEYLKICGTGKFALGDLCEGQPSLLSDSIGQEINEEYIDYLLSQRENEEDDWEDMNFSASYPLETMSPNLNKLREVLSDANQEQSSKIVEDWYKKDVFAESPYIQRKEKMGTGDTSVNLGGRDNKAQHHPKVDTAENRDVSSTKIFRSNQEINRRRRRSRPNTIPNQSCGDKEQNSNRSNFNDASLNINNSSSAVDMTKSKSSHIDIGPDYGEDEHEEHDNDLKESSRPYKERDVCPIARFEFVEIGKSYNANVIPFENPDDPTSFFRHRDEISGFCCSQERCTGYLELHQKVGHSALEVLKKLLIELLHYAMDSRFNRLKRSKLWLRKKMVATLYDSMQRKAGLYNNDHFKVVDGITDPRHELRFVCNELLTANYTVLEVLLESITINKQVCQLLREREIQQSKVANIKKLKEKMANLKILQQEKTASGERKPRCLFCAKLVKGDFDPGEGCYDMEKLVKFFSRDTCIVAEKEINMEFQTKFSIQNYCAMIVNISKKELLIELEDPPLVLSTKVCRAMIFQLLVESLPKHTSVQDMSAEELRRIGTRRQRIQARHDQSIGTKLKESYEEKRNKALIQAMIDEFAVKWRINVKENMLHYCATLLAQCLVQERILGLSIYSGFISKDHELLLNNNPDRLNEIEEKAYSVLLDLCRTLFEPEVKKILDSGPEVDILFTKQKGEFNYFSEAISVIQVSLMPTFLKSSCYYVDDIVTVKIKEFKSFTDCISNMKFSPSPQDSVQVFEGFIKHVKETQYKFKERPLKFKEEIQHMNIASPILRWGNVAVKGEPPIQNDLMGLEDLSNEDYEKMMHDVYNKSSGDNTKESTISNMIKARKQTSSFIDQKSKEDTKGLQTHLAKVQARITDQIAIASQSMADAYVLDTDYQRDYLPEELFNVEFYCTGKMEVPFATIVGVFLGLGIIAVSITVLTFATMWVSKSGSGHWREWMEVFSISMVIYALIIELLKCAIFSVFNFFNDCF